MARFEKSRPKRAKPHAAVAPPAPRASTAPVDRGHDVLPAAAAPREVDVRPPRAVLRPRLRPVRRRRGRRRGRRHLPRRRRGVGAVRLRRAGRRPRRTRRTPRRGATSRPPYETEGETAEAIAALDTGDRARPEGPDAVPPARRPPPRRTRPSASRTRSSLQSVAAFRAPSQASSAPHGASGQPVVSGPDRERGQLAGEPSASRPRSRTRGTYGGAAPSTRTSSSSPLQPNDPNVQLELAQAAQQTGDAATAIAAYERFLKLAPDDPSATIVREQLKQLSS